MKNLIAFNLFLFLILFAFNSHAACEAGQMTKLTSSQNVERKNMQTGNSTVTTLPKGSEVHVTKIEKNEIQIYAMRGMKGEYIGAVAKLNPKKEIVLECQKS